MKIQYINKRAFTLIELVIVVLIICVLAAIAIPGYQKSIEKSKTAETLEILASISSAQQRYLLAQHQYASSFGDLDVDLVDKDGKFEKGTTLKTQNFEIEMFEGVNGLENTAFVQGNRVKGNINPYTIYKCLDNGAIVCEDNYPDDNITCSNIGVEMEVSSSSDPCGALDSLKDKNKCSSIGGFWSSATGTCYTDNAERCSAVSGTLEGDICKFTDSTNSLTDKILDDGMACYGSGPNVPSQEIPYNDNISRTYTGSCLRSVINDGGVCYGLNGAACAHSTINEGGICQVVGNGACPGSIINNGGVCEGGSGDIRGCYYTEINEGGLCKGTSYMACYRSVINDGGICNATATGSYYYGCKEVTVNDGGVCVGNGRESCRQAVINDGGIMVARDSSAGYLNTYNGSGCCVDCTGTGYCHDSGHVCNVTEAEKARYCAM